MKKKQQKKKQQKNPAASKHEIVVRVQQDILPTPTTQELSEPMKEGKKLTIPKTWVSADQILRMTEVTPRNQVYRRPAKGGGTWDYVTVSYVQRVLDYVFGFNWDFEIVEHGKEKDHVWVLGRLTVRGTKEGERIVKTQFGRSEVKHKKGSEEMLDYGNDLKAASSDALKKCASMLGIARDIYGKMDYKQESGREPIPSESTALPIRDESAAKMYSCVGISGKGCAYGIPEISEAQHNYSMKLYQKSLCKDCQGDIKK